MDGNKLYLIVRDALEEKPDLLRWVIDGMSDGMAFSVLQTRRDQTEWETIAYYAMNKRLMNGDELFLADKIDALKPRSSLNWGWFVGELRKIVAKKQDKE